MSMEDNYEVIPLYTRPDLLLQCVHLLNSQWPRSETARIRTLEQNVDDSLPISLLLVLKAGGVDGALKVIGHSKLSPIPSRPTECFVESDSSLRGKGLGRRVMEGTENFAKSKGITAINLTTHDQQGFYKCLGYEESEPIVVYGGVSPSLQKIIFNHASHLNHPPAIASSQSTSTSNKNLSSPSSELTITLPSPPPGPALQIIHCGPGPAKTYMRKKLFHD